MESDMMACVLGLYYVMFKHVERLVVAAKSVVRSPCKKMSMKLLSSAQNHGKVSILASSLSFTI